MAEAAPQPDSSGLSTEERTELFFAHQDAADRTAVRETLALLTENLKPESLDEAFHRPSAAYGTESGEVSLLEALHENPQQAYRTVRESFRWDELA